jgi:hypothetical protein
MVMRPSDIYLIGNKRTKMIHAAKSSLTGVPTRTHLSELNKRI